MCSSATTSSVDASGPGLVLAGYVGRFVYARIQVLGETECSYLNSLTPDERRRNLQQFFSFPLVGYALGELVRHGAEPGARVAGVVVAVVAVFVGDLAAAGCCCGAC